MPLNWDDLALKDFIGIKFFERNAWNSESIGIVDGRFLNIRGDKL